MRIDIPDNLRDSGLWEDKPFSKIQAYLDLQLFIKNQLSIRKIANRWGWGRGKVEKFLKMTPVMTLRMTANAPNTKGIWKGEKTVEMTPMMTSFKTEKLSWDERVAKLKKKYTARFVDRKIDEMRLYFEQHPDRRGHTKDLGATLEAWIVKEVAREPRHDDAWDLEYQCRHDATQYTEQQFNKYGGKCPLCGKALRKL